MPTPLPLWCAPVIGLVSVVSTACGNGTEPAPIPALETYSFERSMEGWLAEGIDLDDPPVEWDIARRDSLAATGEWSVRLHLANYNDAGKIWIRRQLSLPAGTYLVELAFQFASRDFGLANLWTVIAGVTSTAPQSAEALPFRGHTGNGYDADVGWVWSRQQYADSVTVGPGVVAHAVVGVWGTWETPRTYYIDDIEIRVTPVGTAGVGHR